MRLTRFALRSWITLTSVVSFATGWIMLAHAPKPAQPGTGASNSAVPIPTLAPLPPLDLSGQSGGGQGATQFEIQPPRAQAFSSMPLFSTGGS